MNFKLRNIFQKPSDTVTHRGYAGGAKPKPVNPVDWLPFRQSGRAGFYRYVRDRVPLVSAAVWAWVRSCLTPQKYLITGPEREKTRAEETLKSLGNRIFEGISRKDGIKSLLELFFLEIFTTGRFAGEIVPEASGRGIGYFHTIDAFAIQWEKHGRWRPFIEREGRKTYLDNDRFFYYGLGADMKNPAGVSPIASIPFVTEIEQRMVEDMALASHNAGTPRMHIKIAPPEPQRGESADSYAKRAQSYFDDTVENFSRLDADDNIVTWADVEVSVVGGFGSAPYTWRINREQVIEDVITGMRLFPWVVGRTHGTTKNWVQAQFNLLMQEVDSVQEEAKALADWLRNTELALRGIRAEVSHQFALNQDPFMLDKARAQSIQLDTIDRKVQRGYISKEDGAKELGYHCYYREDEEDADTGKEEEGHEDKPDS